MEDDNHDWLMIGENTKCSIFWCSLCGALDDGDEILFPSKSTINSKRECLATRTKMEIRNHTFLRELDNRNLADVERYRSASMEALRAEIKRLQAELADVKTKRCHCVSTTD